MVRLIEGYEVAAHTARRMIERRITEEDVRVALLQPRFTRTGNSTLGTRGDQATSFHGPNGVKVIVLREDSRITTVCWEPEMIQRPPSRRAIEAAQIIVDEEREKRKAAPAPPAKILDFDIDAYRARCYATYKRMGLV